VFTGEFGRTPMSQGGNGRDHHMKGFSILLSGGSVKGGGNGNPSMGGNAGGNVGGGASVGGGGERK